MGNLEPTLVVQISSPSERLRAKVQISTQLWNTNGQPLGSISAHSLEHFLRKSSSARESSHEYSYSYNTPFEIVARDNGALVLSQWLDGGSLFRAIDQVRKTAPTANTIQLCVVTAKDKVTGPQQLREALTREKNGRIGLELCFNGEYHRVSPLETIATNRSLLQWATKFFEARAIRTDQFFMSAGQVSLLFCKQFVIECKGDRVRVIETFRGNRLISSNNVHLTDDLIAGMSRWFTANLSADGALPYKYWPSSGTYSSADNPIRRFMATVALNRLALSLGRQDLKTAARRNLEFNLGRFYRQHKAQGVIEWDQTIKLGALAVAGIAIVESPFGAMWQTELYELRKSIDALWQPSGAFRTFVHPCDRNDNQNFYPGEALLFWATCLEKTREPELLERCLKSFYYYRSHFRRNPNPAFVPWHTQAATVLYRLTQHPDLRDFAFEMNDWLLPHQQWGGGALAPDSEGRFYSPNKKEFGPPHASATGVYLEGLVDALTLAHNAGELNRADRYASSINRGVRSLAQLQFRDSIDTYYISQRRRVIGAIRSEVDDNEIRIDNMQHGLMALLKLRDFARASGEAVHRGPAINSRLE